MNIDAAKLRAQILGCWIGKNIGGTLGGPYEFFPTVNNLTFYDPVPTGAMANDDLELQAMYVSALSAQASPLINSRVLADIWRKHMNYHVDEYAVAMKNLDTGIYPPWSGIYDNYYIDGMGAAIRSELWACLAPGNPALAAKFAREDACIDHFGAGIDAEVFFAAAEAMAFVEADIRKLIQCGLDYLPQDSELAASIRHTCQLWDEHQDWLKVRNILFKEYATEFRTSVRINIPFAVLALLAGNGDFGKTVCTATNCGMDTDCTAATTGALLGIINPEAIPEPWKQPVGNELVVRSTAITGLEFPPTIEAFTDQILQLRERLAMEVTPVDAPKPDFDANQVPFEVAFQKNLHWYCVKLDKLQFQSARCNPIYSHLAIPQEFRGNGGQVVLRFRFEIPEDGQYTVIFNSPTSNQVYLDPETTELHDDKHMTFGRQRLWAETMTYETQFPCSSRQVIFNPTLGGAPLNQYVRYRHLSKGLHTLIAVLEPLEDEAEIIWGIGVGQNRFLYGIYR